MNSSVIRRISKRVFQENKARQIFQKTNISYPLIRTCVSGGKKCSFFGKFDLLCFLETPVLRFALLPYYRRICSSLFWFPVLFITWSKNVTSVETSLSFVNCLLFLVKPKVSFKVISTGSNIPF